MLFMFFLVLFSALEVPFLVAFQPPTASAMQLCDLIVDLFFFLDVCINMRSSYYEDGRCAALSGHPLSLSFT